MQAKYFPDTDTLLFQFNDHEIAEPYDVSDDVLVEIDKEGRLVSMTMEHATRHTNVSEFLYQRVSV